MGRPAANQDESRREANGRQGIEEKILWEQHSKNAQEKELKPSAYFSPDSAEFLFLLHKYGVRYLIVGGEAVIYYGHVRLTGDIDIFYENTARNSNALFKALNDFWNDDTPGVESAEELRRKGMVFQFGIPPNRIDLMNSITRVEFDDAWEKKVIKKIVYKKKEFAVYYIGIDDLIKNKKAVNRNKDKDDLKFLRKAIRNYEL